MRIVDQVVGAIQETVELYYFLRVHRLNRVLLTEFTDSDPKNQKYIDEIVLAGLCVIKEVEGRYWVVDVSEDAQMTQAHRSYMEFDEMRKRMAHHAAVPLDRLDKTISPLEMMVVHIIAGSEACSFKEILEWIQEKDKIGSVTHSAVSNAVQFLKRTNVITMTDIGFRLTWRL